MMVLNPESRKRAIEVIKAGVEPVRIYWTENGRTESEVAESAFDALIAAGFHVAEWRKVEEADKDGSLKLIAARDVEEHATEDELTVRTIGHNNFENDEVDHWQMAGWCWDHDHFTEMYGGVPVRIMDLPETPKDMQ